jgi:hypothetical protein
MPFWSRGATKEKANFMTPGHSGFFEVLSGA